MLPDTDDKDFEDMAPSADPALDATAADAAQAAPVADDANSSTAAPGDTEDEGLLSVVRDVMDARKPEEQAASPAEGEEDPEKPGDADAKEPDNEDYSDVPFHKHPRFQQLLRKAKASEQDATRYQNVQNFMDQNGLGAEEAADLLVIGGLMKTNPSEAWKRMKPTIQKLLVASGEVLDPELAARVQRGEIDKAAALEVSRSRATAQSLQASQSFQDRRRQQTEQQSAGQAITQAATDWEGERRAKDPNFEAKMPLLMKEVAYLQRVEGVPNSPEGVRAQLAKAYKSVVPPAAAAAPTQAAPAPKKAITPIRGGAVAGGAKPEIKDTMDVLKNVMAKRA